MAENKNHLGLDKYQVTVIKSNYNSTKPIRKMVEKAESKISAAKEKLDATIAAAQQKYEESVKEMIAEMEAYKSQIDMLDNFTRMTTKQSCGIELSSEQVIKFLDDVTAWANFMQEHNGTDLFDNTQTVIDEKPFPENLDAEEDKEWEDRIASGELKEAV